MYLKTKKKVLFKAFFAFLFIELISLNVFQLLPSPISYLKFPSIWAEHQALVAGFAGIGLACCFIWWKSMRTEGSKLLKRIKAIDDLKKVTWVEFELLVGEAYRNHGWSVLETGLGGADGGIDLRIKKIGTSGIVQVKHWKGRVGAPVVREMYGLMIHHKVKRVDIVGLGGFTAEAFAFAKGKPIGLIDADQLLNMLGHNNIPQVKSKASNSGSNSEWGKSNNSESSRSTNTKSKQATPDCPKCGSKMKSRNRTSDGTAFWGCTGYPNCKGIRKKS